MSMEPVMSKLKRVCENVTIEITKKNVFDKSYPLGNKDTVKYFNREIESSVGYYFHIKDTLYKVKIKPSYGSILVYLGECKRDVGVTYELFKDGRFSLVSACVALGYELDDLPKSTRLTNYFNKNPKRITRLVNWGNHIRRKTYVFDERFDIWKSKAECERQ